MGVGLFLTGTYPSAESDPSPEDWLAGIAAWLEGHEEEPLMKCQAGQTENEEPALYVQIHLCAEDVELSVPAPGVCAVTAKTSTVGPGYHLFLCQLLHSLGTHFQIGWDSADEEMGTGDETGFFFAGDANVVCHEMRQWLSALARVVVENCKDEAIAMRMVSMPLDYSFPDETGILTPLGPRPLQWFERLIDDPEHGLDFFPWWDEGVGADFFLGRALCTMWQQTRWRVPITEEEGASLMDTHLDLERALHLNPEATLPWREWREILEYLREYFGYVEFQHQDTLAEEIERRARSADASKALIGYRRGSVQVALTGGWSITIPGEFAEEWEENGETWSAWSQGRTIWFTSWSVKGETDEKVAPREILDGRPWPDEGERIEHEDGNLVGRAVFLRVEEDGETLWNLKAYSAVAGSFALCNFYLENRDDLPAALAIWKSLRN